MLNCTLKNMVHQNTSPFRSLLACISQGLWLCAGNIISNTFIIASYSLLTEPTPPTSYIERHWQIRNSLTQNVSLFQRQILLVTLYMVLFNIICLVLLLFLHLFWTRLSYNKGLTFHFLASFSWSYHTVFLQADLYFALDAVLGWVLLRSFSGINLCIFTFIVILG